MNCFYTRRLSKSALLISSLFALLCFTRCKKFLAEGSDKSLVIPSSLQDVQSLLDNFNQLNASYYPTAGESDDDYYLLDDYYNSRSDDFRNLYIWNKEANADAAWNSLYSIILFANVALEALDDIKATTQNMGQWNQLQGTSLYLRAYAYYFLVQYFATPYRKEVAKETPGIPIRQNSDWNKKSVRSSLQASYDQIINDLKQATLLLPVSNPPVSRPSRTAAFALLARTYLAMEEYQLAEKFADSCLYLYDTLIDYNSVGNTSSNTPFARFNEEVIFHSQILSASELSPTNWKVDSLLFESYEENDLRKSIYFRPNGGFKGDYGASTGGGRFNGIAVDEVYLIRAECRARAGDKDAAMDDLNTLLRKRWKTGLFTDITASTSEEALRIILSERRKELVARQTRWFDLRRLNKDERFKKTLKRNIEGTMYDLPPNDTRYTFYIPIDVIALTGMQQNTR